MTYLRHRKWLANGQFTKYDISVNSYPLDVANNFLNNMPRLERCLPDFLDAATAWLLQDTVDGEHRGHNN